MNSDKDDLAILCRDMTKEEVDRVYRLLHEWGTGPEDSFPVQFVLLTRAQLRAAASIPRSIADSQKWLEQHLAEYRRQSKTTVDGFTARVDDKIQALKTVVETHGHATQENANSIQGRFVMMETVAHEIREQLQSGVVEWNRAKDKFVDERWHFERVCKQLDERLNWWNVCWFIIGAVVFLGVGTLVGHYGWKP
jgi:hypothetical protein